ncbi:MAG: NlpC/P60 family protein [Bacteroidota bacterium]
MTKGISLQGFVPVRQEPSHTSGMVSQILFGENFTILETMGSWVLVKLDFDKTEGWVNRGSIMTAEAETGQRARFKLAVRPTVSVRDLTRGRLMILPAGAVWNHAAGKTWMLGGRQFELLSEEGWKDPGAENDPETTGTLLLSLPGIQGGRCGFGFDAPGLVQFLCRTLGIHLPRDCRAQAESGSPVNFIHEVKKGDLAFFDNTEGEIIHVGMALGQGRIIHAYDQVRIDILDHQGIFNAETEGYSHRLRIIKRPI